MLEWALWCLGCPCSMWDKDSMHSNMKALYIVDEGCVTYDTVVQRSVF